jgi:signal transduction histidine kinase
MADFIHRRAVKAESAADAAVQDAPSRREWVGATIAIIVIIAAMLMVVSGLGGAILRHLDATSESRLRNAAEARYMLGQLQRETLRLQRRVSLYAINRDRDGTHLQAQLVQSRFNVIFSPLYFNALNPVARAAVNELREEWAEFQPAFAQFLNEPTQARAELLTSLLEGLELGVNRASLGFNEVVIGAFRHISSTSDSLHTNLLLSGGMLAGFALIGGVWIVNNARRQGRLRAQLEQARAAEQAERQARRFQDDFLAHVSHELRHPLYMIIGFLGVMCMDDSLPDSVVQRLNRLRAHADALLEQLNNLLDSARTASGRIEVVETRADLLLLISEWRQLISLPLSERPLTLEMQIAPDMPQMVQVDTELLTRVVVNLLLNAIKFTPEGKICLSITRDADPAFWQLTVADTGIGIPPDVQTRIFERFFRVRSASQPGSGLGLYIVQAHVQAMGGTIAVHSAPGQGSTFQVRLPLRLPCELHGELHEEIHTNISN